MRFTRQREGMGGDLPEQSMQKKIPRLTDAQSLWPESGLDCLTCAVFNRQREGMGGDLPEQSMQKKIPRLTEAQSTWWRIEE